MLKEMTFVFLKNLVNLFTKNELFFFNQEDLPNNRINHILLLIFFD